MFFRQKIIYLFDYQVVTTIQKSYKIKKHQQIDNQ